ncbi:hypothetical protein Bca4012_019867 [Brassica carinata]|uniref:Uncharacterized protein n=1 Tax=Brassica carinata TaxID=52824 RepID=A0A8X8BDM6_BRACI|nr:hypothetical protein Bca52824_001728 [Brassica carinata]
MSDITGDVERSQGRIRRRSDLGSESLAHLSVRIRRQTSPQFRISTISPPFLKPSLRPQQSSPTIFVKTGFEYRWGDS